MKADEVIKALRCEENLGSEACKDCHYGKEDGLCLGVDRDAADLLEQLRAENERLKAEKSVWYGEVASHSEKEIANGCITLMHELVGRFEEYLEFVEFEPKCEDERFCVRFYYSEIIRTLFLEGTSHSGGTSTSKKCRELGFGYSKTIDFEIERRVEE